MARRKYEARVGGPLDDDGADLVGREMDAMETGGVPVTPPHLLERATPPRSPLHPLFEWRDGEAAHSFRIIQAERYMAAVRVLIEDVPRRARYTIRVEVKDEPKTRRERVRREVILASTAHLAQVSRDLYQRMCAVLLDAEGLGLTRAGAWKKIAQVLRDNPPI